MAAHCRPTVLRPAARVPAKPASTAMPDDSRTFDVPLAGISRRRLFQITGAVAAAVLTPAGRILWPGGALHGADVTPSGETAGGDVFRSGSGSATHPDPRPGITGEHVLTAGQ